ncbi:hypothetical protein ENH_00066260 [Eimeria necatrix]|uniref:RRM domain-containing protein n=1 Tax=Eimeria necatrix TaxID=51315 RepID=U6N3B5_9EIME|nr:hypothetical protein ENH_00066260 [Eimeria necatrix]CDJ69224.1 hypothetical protein ENH_00066260 [Eimeria necatrix]
MQNLSKELREWWDAEAPQSMNADVQLSYETSEKKLRRELEAYGTVRRVRVVLDTAGRARGCAFVEFERDRDMKEAYKKADGTKIDGKRILVDVKTARTVSGWLPG